MAKQSLGETLANLRSCLDGLVEFDAPEELSLEGIQDTIGEYAQ